MQEMNVPQTPPIDKPQLSSEEKKRLELEKELQEMRFELDGMERLEREDVNLSVDDRVILRGLMLQLRLAIKHEETWDSFREQHAKKFKDTLCAMYPPSNPTKALNDEEFIHGTDKDIDLNLVLNSLEEAVYH